MLAMAPHRLRDYKYSHFLRCFKIRRWLFDCSFSFSFTQIVRLWHDACALDSMERNAYIRACELSQHWIPQSVTCLATDACLTADPGVASSIPARYHTFVEIDHEIISTVILLPSADSFKKGCCQLQAKVCAQITG